MMKNFTRLCTLILIVFLVSNLSVAQKISSVTGTLVRVTPKLSEIDGKTMYGQPLQITRDKNGVIGHDEEGEERIEKKLARNAKKFPDGALQKPLGSNLTATTPVSTINNNFDGQSWSNIDPSDNNIAVGPNHVIQMVNSTTGSSIKIWDKAGNVVQNTISFTSITGIVGAGDPVVVYDQLADRWIMTEFGPGGATQNYLVMAVSATPNPLGAWNVYQYIDNTYFPDYPKYSVWHNAYYARSSDFSAAGSYMGASIYAFDRNAMLAGAATAKMVKAKLVDNGPVSYYYMNTIGLDGTTPSSQSGLFAVPDQANSKINIFEFTPNFSNPGASTVGALVPLSIASYSNPPGNVSQQGSTGLIGTLGSRLMYRLSYRNRGGTESILIGHTVQGSSTTNAAVRWYEFRKVSGSWTTYQQGTLPNADGNSRFMPGISMDASGNIALMYNVAGPTAYPSIRYTGRNSADPLGQMTLPEQVIINGLQPHAPAGFTAPYRWGDYNTLIADPSNNSFWATAEYGGGTTTPVNATRIANFTLGIGSTLFSTQPSNISLCAGGTASFTASAAGDPPTTYQWQRSNDNGVTWTNITGATNATYSFATVAADNGSKFRCVATGANTTANSNVATLSMVAASVGGAVTPSSSSICAVSSTSGVLTLSGQVGNVLNWQSSPDNVNWTNISNTTTSLNYTATATTYYRAVVQGAGCSAAANSSSASVTIVPGTPINIATDLNLPICSGTPVRLTAQTGGLPPTSDTLAQPSIVAANAGITFNFANNNPFPVTITSISSLMNYTGGLANVSAYYNTTAINGAPAAITPANGWIQFGSNSLPSVGGVMTPLMSNLNLVVPAGATYGIVLYSINVNGSTTNLANIIYSNSTTPNLVATAGGCSIITGTGIGYSCGALPPAATTGSTRHFNGVVTFKAAGQPVTTGTFSWSPATGLSSTNINPVAAAPTATTTYTVTNNDGAGCARTASITVNVLAPPTVTSQPSNISVCPLTSATFTASGTSLSGFGYQWQESNDGGLTYHNLAVGANYSGVNAGTLTVMNVSASMNNNLYRLAVTGSCPSAFSNAAKLTVLASPAVTISPALSCGGVPGISGTLLTASGNADSLVWAPIDGLFTDALATVAYTGKNAAKVYAAPSAFTTYTATGYFASNGCGTNATTMVNYTPNGPIISPNPAGICIGGSNVVRLTKSLPATLTFNSGTINIPIADANPSGTAPNTLNVSGIPNGATITAVAVTLNATHTYIGDMSFNLKAPNGRVLNLDRNLTGTGNPGANFVNTVISSASTTKLSAGTAPFTGTFGADAINSLTAGYTYSDPTGYPADAKSFSDLYSVPNGPWTLASADDGAGDSGIIKSWTLTITYQVGLPSTSPVWTPITYLFNDSAATSPYVAGTAKDTVWSKPPLTPHPASYTYQAISNSLPITATSTANMANTPTTVYYTNTFNFRNNNSFPVTITNLSSFTNTTGATNVSAWYNTTAINGTPSAITAANGWNQFGSGTITATGAVQPFLSNLSLTVPAGATYGIIVSAATTAGAGNLVFSSTLTQPIASAGGCDIITGPNVGYTGAALPAAPTINPYYFIGTVGFVPSLAPCTSPATNVVVNVNDTVLIVTQPVAKGICTNLTGSISVGATGSFLTYQWQVATSSTGTYSNVNNGGVYSGATTATLSITAPPASMNGYLYRCVISGAAPCGGKTSNSVALTVNPIPTVTIAASPYQNIYPGLTTTINSTVSPSAGSTYTWFNNGTKVSGTASKLPVSIDGVGSYTLTAVDVNGCTGSSNTVVIGDSTSSKVFVYPNPSSGVFQVRYYNTTNILTYPRGLNVYNARGRRILTKSNPINSPYAPINVDLTNEGAGVYWLEIVDVNNNRLAMGRVEILR